MTSEVIAGRPSSQASATCAAETPRASPMPTSVVDLLADEALAMLTLADSERLHHMPTGIVRAADVAHEPAPDQAVEGLERLLQRRRTVPLMELVEIDDIGA
jgi:hypothetical protein